MWRPHLFCLGSRPDAHWQEVLGLVTKTRVASAVARELANRIFGIFTIGYTAVACFFPPLTAAAVGHAASCGTQRASPVNAHISTCQSGGADLSPANLSCQASNSWRLLRFLLLR